MFSNSKLLSSHKGHFVGKAGKIEKNPYRVYEDNEGKFIEMFDSLGRSFYLDYDDLEKIRTKTEDGVKKVVTWNLVRNHKVSDRIVYYVSAHYKYNNVDTTIRLHQIIMNHYGNGCKGLTVDHIDRNTLNNRKYNLRLANKTEQLQNMGKRTRKKSANPVPENIKHLKIPKYMFYLKYKSNNIFGFVEAFRIEYHPALKSKKSSWTTSSMKKTIEEKYKEACEKLKELDKLLIEKQHIQIAGNS